MKNFVLPPVILFLFCYYVFCLAYNTGPSIATPYGPTPGTPSSVTCPPNCNSSTNNQINYTSPNREPNNINTTNNPNNNISNTDQWRSGGINNRYSY